MVFILWCPLPLVFSLSTILWDSVRVSCAKVLLKRSDLYPKMKDRHRGSAVFLGISSGKFPSMDISGHTSHFQSEISNFQSLRQTKLGIRLARCIKARLFGYHGYGSIPTDTIKISISWGWMDIKPSDFRTKGLVLVNWPTWCFEMCKCFTYDKL